VLLRIPPLMERPGDVPVLTRHFLSKHNAELGRQVDRVSREVADLFGHYGWPGNVRELEHVVEGAMNVVGERDAIGLGDLPPYLLHARRQGAPAAPAAHPPERVRPAASQGPGPVDLRREQEERERTAIEDALAAARGNVSAAARRLGISRQLLRYKLAKHGLERTRFLTGSPEPEA